MPMSSFAVTAVCVLLLAGAGPARSTRVGAGDCRGGETGFVTAEPSPWPEGWNEMTPIPTMPGNNRDMVRHGGFCVAAPDGYIYAAKGNRLQSFYRYDPLADEPDTLGPWEELAAIPLEPVRSRPIGRGTVACYAEHDGNGCIYVAHGSNTLAFQRYDIGEDRWEAMADVPLGAGRRVRGGGYMVFVPGQGGAPGYVYFAKGDRLEFYRYDVAADTWEPRAEMPFGFRGRWRSGCWLAHDGGNYIYAHQARDFLPGHTEPAHLLWRYHVAEDAWDEEPLPGMPLFGLEGGGTRRRRSSAGSSGAFDGAGELLYALKGGNSNQFWVFCPDAREWTALDPVPDSSRATGGRRRVGAGGYLTFYLKDGYEGFFALKGNRTPEFWRYVVPADDPVPRPRRSSVMAGGSRAGAPSISIGPNPLLGGIATLRIVGLGHVPHVPRLTATVYDVSGREVLSRSLSNRGLETAPTGEVSLDMRALNPGIYVVKLEAGVFTATRKVAKAE